MLPLCSPPSLRLLLDTLPAQRLQRHRSRRHEYTKNVLVMTSKHEDLRSSLQTTAQPSSHPTMSSKASSRQLPPPEKPEATRTRFRVIAAFWAVIIFLGFPIWWKTTSIYRAHLPIQEMVDWANGKVSACSPDLPAESCWIRHSCSTLYRPAALYFLSKSVLKHHLCLSQKRSIFSELHSIPLTI
jgi:hypothetical protein